MPKVSVIIPNYNHAPYLEQRIDSVLNQTYQDFEIIILDDCSTDNSREVIEKYRSHEKVRTIIYNETNSGSPFKQWKKGIELAVGEWIWIAESDDWCEIFFLSNLVDFSIQNPNTVLAFSQSYCVEGENEIKWISTQKKIENLVEGKRFVSEYLINGNAIFNASMAIFRKDIFFKISCEYTTYHFCGDWLFWSEIAVFGNVFISGKVHNYFRKHAKDVSGKAYSSGLNFIEELKILFNLLNRNLINDSEFSSALVNKYLKYKTAHYQFAQDRKQEIIDLFFKSDLTKIYRTRLRVAYLKFNIKRIISKLKPW